MPNSTPKKLPLVTAILSVFLCSILLPAAAQPEYRLKVADSLFAAKKFTQSAEHYKAILASGYATPALYIRLAFIEEGLLHPQQALAYLQESYALTLDPAVAEKMADLARKWNLNGFETNSPINVLTIYQHYASGISFLLLGLAFLFIAIGAFMSRFGSRPIVPAILAFLVLAGYGIHIFMASNTQSRILTSSSPIYLMKGPSPASGVVGVIPPGHRVLVSGQKDVWTKFIWNGSEVWAKLQ